MSEKIKESSEELLFPPFILLLKTADMLIEKSNRENVYLTTDELRETIKEVVVEYCCQAWNECRMPMYVFKYRWYSPELERDLEILFKHFIQPPSKITLTERGKNFLKREEELLYPYEERIRKAIDEVYKRKEKRSWLDLFKFYIKTKIQKVKKSLASYKP